MCFYSAGYIIFISSVSICNDGSRRWESIPERPTTTCTLSLLFLPFCSPALFARPKMLTFFSRWPLISHLWRSNELSSFLFVRSLIYYQLCHQSWDFHLSESWLGLVNTGQGILQVWEGRLTDTDLRYHVSPAFTRNMPSLNLKTGKGQMNVCIFLIHSSANQ